MNKQSDAITAWPVKELNQLDTPAQAPLTLSKSKSLTKRNNNSKDSRCSINSVASSAGASSRNSITLKKSNTRQKNNKTSTKSDRDATSPGGQGFHIFKSIKGLTIPKNFNLQTQLRVSSKEKVKRENKSTKSDTKTAK